MTTSLQIFNGDLSVSGPGGLATVNGQQKLVQDLRNWILEPRGTDPSHPDYGSNIDGGFLPDGSTVDPMVGQAITPELITDLEAELRRILNSYQQQQADRINQEVILYAGKTTYSPGELLASIDDIAINQVADVLVVVITLTTDDGSQLSFFQPLPT